MALKKRHIFCCTENSVNIFDVDLHFLYYYLCQIAFFSLPLNESVGVCCAEELFFL